MDRELEQVTGGGEDVALGFLFYFEMTAEDTAESIRGKITLAQPDLPAAQAEEVLARALDEKSLGRSGRFMARIIYEFVGVYPAE